MSEFICISSKNKSGNIYRTINITAINDENLSLKAKGLYTLLRTRPVGWDKIWTKSIKKYSTDGETAIRTARQELIDNGYVYNIPIREKGRIVKFVLIIVDEPFMLTEEDIKEEIERIRDFLDLENLNVGSSNKENQTLRENNNIREKKNDRKKKKRDFSKTEKIQYLNKFPIEWQNNLQFQKTWKEFLQHRKELKKSITPTSFNRMRIKLEKLSNQNLNIAIQILDRSIENGWQGIFPLDNQKSNNNKSSGRYYEGSYQDLK